MRSGTRSRDGFTLVELLVVMALMAVLATLTIAFFPNAASSAREARAASLLQGWLNVAKQRALRDQAPRGLRILRSAADPNQSIECQYIEQPDDFTGGQISSPSPIAILSANEAGNDVTIMTALPHGLSAGETVLIKGVVGTPEYNGGYVVTAVTAANIFKYTNPVAGLTGVGAGGDVTPMNRINFSVGIDLMNGYLPATPGSPTYNEIQLWAVQPGDYLEIFGTGLMYRVYSVNLPTQITIDPPLPYPITVATGTYRILRAPRAVGDEALKLPDNTVIDLLTNTANNNPLPPSGPGYVDILFSPSGAVISRGASTTNIHLWVRSPNQDFPLDPYRGDPTLISIFANTGLVGAYPPAPLAMGNPYLLVQ